MAVAHGTEKATVLAHKAAIDRHLEEAGIPVGYTNVFWGGRSEIKPSEVLPGEYERWCRRIGDRSRTPCGRAEHAMRSRACARRRTHAPRRDPLAAPAARARVLARSAALAVVRRAGTMRTARTTSAAPSGWWRALAALGPTFVKMAQLFAGRTDLLAPVYARGAHDTHRPGAAGAARRDRAGDHARSTARRRRSCSSGSTRCRSPRRRSARCTARGYAGEEVVIKVLRPGVEALVAEDVRVSPAHRRASSSGGGPTRTSSARAS